MSNTTQLLYILPDLAYSTQLAEEKKPNTFNIQSFRQINGEFMNDDELLAENILKLFSKLEKGQAYQLILPDFLFTNTILTIKETSQSKITSFITNSLLPELEISKKTHHIEHSLLTEFKGTAKVQLSAIEKSLLSPVRAAAKQAGVTITSVSPLSWTIKSAVSLEPSVSVLQIGSQLYCALHYIGVDQATIAPIQEMDAIGETIKTLKGAEPSIQTVYLLTNAIVEEQLKKLVSDTLPLQQLTTAGDDEGKIPSYVEHIITAGARTLSIEDYPVPRFELDEPSEAELKEHVLKADNDSADDEPTVASDDESVLDSKESEEDTKSEESDSKKTDSGETDLPAPTQLPVVGAPVAEVRDIEEVEEVEKIEEVEEIEEVVKTEVVGEKLPTKEVPPKKEVIEKPPTTEEVVKVPEVKKADRQVAPVASKATETTNDESDDEVDLSQFINPQVLGTQQAPAQSATPATTHTHKVIIKNRSGIGAMLRMIFITLTVFTLTVGIGVGIGFGILNMGTQNQTQEPTLVAVVTPEPEPEPTPTPEPELDRSELSIRVVNATTKAGYAGVTQSLLQKAGYKSVGAANAAEEYEPGLYVLMPEENSALIQLLSEDSELELVFMAGYATEAAGGTYDAIVVLAE